MVAVLGNAWPYWGQYGGTTGGGTVVLGIMWWECYRTHRPVGDHFSKATTAVASTRWITPSPLTTLASKARV